MAVLVGYASRHGATREVAERIASLLDERGLKADAAPVRSDPETGSYDAFVLGSALYQGTWLPEMSGYLLRNASLLAGHPVWLFSLGVAHFIGPGAGKKAREPDELPRVRSAVAPREHRLFAGSVQGEHFGLLGRVMFWLGGGRYGDYRNWSAIDDWADSIAEQLAATPPGGSPGARTDDR
jgi:menaquinone-dependent protoporphyrinogen oxidase